MSTMSIDPDYLKGKIREVIDKLSFAERHSMRYLRKIEAYSLEAVFF